MSKFSIAGILPEKTKLLHILRKRIGEAKLAALYTPGHKMDSVEFNDFLTKVHILLNKNEFDSIFDHWPGGGAFVDVDAFVTDLKTDGSGDAPITHEQYPAESENTAHLALSGVSHLEFGELHKSCPKHWGVPPNAQMKGHDGIMRDLPDGYGKGNAPVFNWVAGNLEKDKKTFTNIRGVKPFPYGNYSL